MFFTSFHLGAPAGGSSKTWEVLLVQVWRISPRFPLSSANLRCTMYLGIDPLSSRCGHWLLGEGVGVPGGAADRLRCKLAPCSSPISGTGAALFTPVNKFNLGLASGLAARKEDVSPRLPLRSGAAEAMNRRWVPHGFSCRLPGRDPSSSPDRGPPWGPQSGVSAWRA